MQRLMDQDYPHVMLDTQYRMVPAISMFPSSHFYGGKLVDDEGLRRLAQGPVGSMPAYAFFHIPGRESRDIDGGTHNMLEAKVILKLLRLCKGDPKCSALAKKYGVGIISFYKQQVEVISQLLPKEFSSYVEVKTVDGFQGQEKGIIILSAVRSNPRGEVGFLKDNRRLNVAITRAKFHLWIVGNEQTIASRLSSKALRSMVQDAKDRALIWREDNRSNASSFCSSLDLSALRKTMALKTGNLGGYLDSALWKVVFTGRAKAAIESLEEEQTTRLLGFLERIANGQGWKRIKQNWSGKATQENQVYLSPTTG